MFHALPDFGSYHILRLFALLILIIPSTAPTNGFTHEKVIKMANQNRKQNTVVGQRDHECQGNDLSQKSDLCTFHRRIFTSPTAVLSLSITLTAT